MGAGSHGGSGKTKGSSSGKASISNIFRRVQYEGTIKIDGKEYDVSRRVYQRNDIDFERTDDKGRTNLERMESGRAPIGSDGNPVQLHHVLQKESGPMVEIREITHREYMRTLHGLGGNGMSFRNNPIQKKQYDAFRRQYWKWRAKEHVSKRRAR